MAQDNHKIDQGEKLGRMAATTKATRERRESTLSPNGQVHIPPEDIEAMRVLTPIALTNEPLPERTAERDYSESEEIRRRREYPDGWERLMDWARDYKRGFKEGSLGDKLWMVLVALFHISVMPLGVKIAVELTAPRATLSYFHTYLIAAGIATIVLLYLRLSHKPKVTNKDDE